MDNTKLKILILASEVSPFAKTSGSADVVSELARALKARDHDVRVALPRYRGVPADQMPEVVSPFSVQLDGMGETVRVLQGSMNGDGGVQVPVYFVDCPPLFDRERMYMFHDDAERFLIFSRAALEMLAPLGWTPDVVHANDWQTAVVPNWLKTIYATNPQFQNVASVYTIHNLAYFGTFGQRILEISGLADFGYIAHPSVSPEINKELNFMARGILYADAVNTVSPTYALDIRTPEFGEGLDPILRMRAPRLRGISNGLDYTRANPATDPAIASRFDAEQLQGRAPNKRALQQLAGLEENDAPLLAFISGGAPGKGLELGLQVSEPVLRLGVQLIVAGAVEQQFADELKELQAKYPRQIGISPEADERLIRQIVAGADMLLAPSRSEPDSTLPLLAMHYGCIPIVSHFAGVTDMVRDVRPADEVGTGFVFERGDLLSCYGAIVRATEAYARPREWHAIQQRGMQEDVSWNRAAQEYVEMYRFAWEEKHRVVVREATLAREIARTAHIIETLPPRICELGDLVYNLWWSWNPDATALLERIDHLLWEESGHNPIKVLRAVDPARLAQLADTDDFCAHYDRVLRAFRDYMRAEATWFEVAYPYAVDLTIAYFSAEFGIHESLPIYSGGLGILSGDHVKEASDMGVPLVGIGFLYPQGYFRQQIDAQGNQHALYDKLDFSEAPALAVKGNDGNDVIVEVALPGRTIYARVWQIQVGRVPLYLMDTDLEQNAEDDRALAARLYGGDHEIRIKQEIVLGIGGVRVLRALGLEPGAYHMNEGHSAFLVLELTRELVEGGMTFEQAMETVAAHSIFTTHTPVPAGNDAFGAELMIKYFGEFFPRLGLDRDEFLQLANDGGLFSMTVLGLKFSDQRNGVSELHGDVSRKMWAHVLADHVSETPIGHITNGVHTATWLAADRYAFYNEVLGANWFARLDDPTTWQPLRTAPDGRMWTLQNERRRALIEFCRDVWARQLARLGAEDTAIERAKRALDPHALTIGSARRFATYKRATLFLSDPERLKRIVNDPARPVQFIFAGKAHPADTPGQQFIRAVYQASLDNELEGKIILLEDYGIDDARMLVQGADVWLNNPRRPLEASGTSGEKAALNGVLNLSILDGWWAEGYDGTNGWALGDPSKNFVTEAEQDLADAEALYELLESEVVPLFYARDEDNVPRGWIEKSKASICTLAPVYSTRRMLKQYCIFYVRAITAGHVDTVPLRETMT